MSSLISPTAPRRELTGPPSASATAWHFRPDIEGLRAIAIIAVVLYHVGWGGMSAGYLGVDVFFVLSGFLITGILADEIERTGTVSLVRFWARRARRLLPAGTLLIIGVLLVDLWVQSPFTQITTAKAARAFALYSSNLLFAWHGANYFAPDLTRNPLLHTWSLAVEEQFYLLYAPLLWLVVRTRSGDDPSWFRKRIALVTAIASVLSFVGCLVLRRYNAVYAFYLLPPRVWEFGLGAFTALMTTRSASTRMASPVVGPVALGLLVIACSRLDSQSHPGWITLVPTLCTVALIVNGGGPRPTAVARLLSSPPLRNLGRLSYSWYLWHWLVIVWTRSVIPNASTSVLFTAAVASLLPAAAAYALVESPIRFSRRLQRYPKQVVAGAVAVAGLAFLASTAAVRHSEAILRRPEMAPIAEAVRTTTVLFTNGCSLATREVRPRPCSFGPGINDTTVVLFGDSHAAQWFPALLRIAEDRGWHLVAWTKSACPAVDVTVIVREVGRPYSECDAWRDTVFNRLQALHPAIVVTTSYGGKYNIVHGDSVFDMDATTPRYSLWTDGLAKTVLQLTAAAGHVIVLEDTPHPKFEVPDCLARHLANAKECAFARAMAVDEQLTRREEDVVRRIPSADYLRTDDLICDLDRCSAERDGIVRYWDDHHISTKFAESLAPALSRRLTDAIRKSDTASRDSVR